MAIMVDEKIVFKKINEIRPYVRNPRKNEKTVELLCKMIPEVGFNVPILIDSDGIIIKGHARYAAAIRLGMTEVPCIVSHASPDAIKVDRITDNKIAEYSKWENKELEQEISQISFDLSDLGLSREEVSKSLAEPLKDAPEASEGLPEGSQPDEEVGKTAERYYKVVCDGCGHVMFVKADALKKG